jgi:hypothetical protein
MTSHFLEKTKTATFMKKLGKNSCLQDVKSGHFEVHMKNGNKRLTLFLCALVEAYRTVPRKPALLLAYNKVTHE